MDSKPRRGDMIIGVIANGKKTPKGCHDYRGVMIIESIANGKKTPKGDMIVF